MTDDSSELVARSTGPIRRCRGWASLVQRKFTDISLIRCGTKAHQLEPLADTGLDSHPVTDPSRARRRDRRRLVGMTNHEPYGIGKGLRLCRALDVIDCRAQDPVITGRVGTDQKAARTHGLGRRGGREAVNHAGVSLVGSAHTYR